jgi:hypothetical protein
MGIRRNYTVKKITEKFDTLNPRVYPGKEITRVYSLGG